jgi:hemolysin III
MASDVSTLERPRYRGVLHQWAFFVSLLAGLVLVLAIRVDALVPTLIYAGSVAALFGTSALYHRVRWSPARRAWMRRLDHAMIFVLIVGTYTPLVLVTLEGEWVHMVYGAVCVVSAFGFIITVGWVSAPKWLVALVYLVVGWMGLALLPALFEAVGMKGIGLLLLGGLLYTTGAIIYARKRPDPSPRVFGYHEIFHALVIAAAAVHFGLVASTLPLA